MRVRRCRRRIVMPRTVVDNFNAICSIVCQKHFHRTCPRVLYKRMSGHFARSKSFKQLRTIAFSTSSLTAVFKSTMTCPLQILCTSLFEMALIVLSPSSAAIALPAEFKICRLLQAQENKLHRDKSNAPPSSNETKIDHLLCVTPYVSVNMKP